MEIWLFHVELNKEIKVELNIEVSYPTSDLFAVFINENETTVLLDGKSSKSYDSYLFRKVLSIAKGYIIHNSIKNHITFAEYLDDHGQLGKFLIESSNEKGYAVFQNNFEFGDYPYKKAILINYNEYLELTRYFGDDEAMSFKEFIKYKVSGLGGSDLNSRFCIPPSEKNDFVSANALTYFLDTQESDQTKTINKL